MQGALHAVTCKGIPDGETDGEGLCQAVLQQIDASELKAFYERLIQLC
jgi:hypothetical protein